MRVMTMWAGAALAAATVYCTGPSPGLGDGSAVVGSWGGTHVGLALTASGGSVEYDCAHGGHSEPVRPGSDGRFEVGGVHVREHGGPVRIDEVPDSVVARYVGRIVRDRMTLRVVVGADTLGPFELQRDTPPRLMKCL
jgi:hypothetical protein